MKKYFSTCFLLLTISFVVNAQQITLEFQNPTITNDGIDDFYEVDVFISSDVDYIQGAGGFLFNYNELAFGSNISTNGNVEYIYDASSIVGSETIGLKNYKDFISNDNISSRAAFFWQQFWSGGTIGENITSTPALLLRIKIKMIDVNASPDVCFDTTSHPAFDDQFFTACGPYGPGLAAADCANEVGAQIFDYTPDCSGAVVISSIDCTGGVTTTWTAGAWNNGVPDNTMNAVINEAYVTTTVGANIDACSLQINGGGLIQVDAGDYVKTESDITVDGILLIQNGGSLVQVDDLATVTKTGNIVVVKETTPVGINGFSILGSPMSGSTRTGVYANQTIVRHHTTSNFSPNTEVAFYDPLVENFADDNGNDWQTHTGAITVGEGFLVTSSDPSDPNLPISSTYNTGTLNNGVYTYTVGFNQPGPDAAANRNASPNILSNPYASAILVDDFLTMNNTIIDAVYFWEHQTVNGSDVNYPGYKANNYDMGDISMINLLGGGVQAPNGGFTPGTTIASGQGFGVKAIADGDIVFNNSLRTTTPNDQYRNSNSIAIERMYVSIKNEAYNLKSSTLIGFTENATEGFDTGYDAKRLATPVSIYSVMDNMELAIQGRSAFNTDQVIPLGFRTMVEEEQTYMISLGNREGENITQATVYLEDRLLNTVTNLSEDSYTFTSNESNQKDRFVIVFAEEQLGNTDVSISSISIYPNPTSDILNIVSPQTDITSVEVYDIRGRLISTVGVENSATYQLNMGSLESAMYFVKINTVNGSITERVIRE